MITTIINIIIAIIIIIIIITIIIIIIIIIIIVITIIIILLRRLVNTKDIVCLIGKTQVMVYVIDSLFRGHYNVYSIKIIQTIET